METVLKKSNDKLSGDPRGRCIVARQKYKQGIFFRSLVCCHETDDTEVGEKKKQRTQEPHF